MRVNTTHGIDSIVKSASSPGITRVSSYVFNSAKRKIAWCATAMTDAIHR
jgi:hypothetical protein